MEQCWNVDPKKRPNINDLWIKIRKISASYYLDEALKRNQESYSSQLQLNIPTSRGNTSNIYQFTNSSEDFDDNTKKLPSVIGNLKINSDNDFDDNTKKLPSVIGNLRINSNNDFRNNDKIAQWNKNYTN
ncbi:hypothetical protein C1646_664188 [Rhizophagus diaphanus]|nr:hypothetical protein C1646_664188 [Rhizophagus diaphanus] [Rhizophagus sp. MUCL 43196]